MTLPTGWAPTSPFHVVGESEADGAFIKAVAAAHGVADFDFTAPKGEDNRSTGKDGFRKHLVALKFFIQREDIKRIVVVGDNDADHAGALSAIQKAIRDAGGYPTPSRAPLEIAKGPNVHVGIIMLPGTGENGCLETLLLKAARTMPPSIACLEQWKDCSGFPEHPKNNYDKFLLRSILAGAVASDPNISIQRMWQKVPAHSIKPDDPAFAWVGAFLGQIFV